MSQKGLSDLQSVYGAEVNEPFIVVISTPGWVRSEVGFIAAACVWCDGCCVQVTEKDNDVMSRKEGNEVCEGVVELLC